MPINLPGAYNQTPATPELTQLNFDSDYRDLYPDDVNLHPGTKVHDQLAKAILERAQDSARHMVMRHPKWRKIDETLTAFISLDAEEKRRRDKDSRKPVSIVIPESYATLETFLTYFMSVFGEAELFRYEGSGPEDVIGAILMEKVVDQQARKGKALLALYSHWRDALSYGIGIATISWRVKLGKQTILDKVGFVDPNSFQFIETGVERIVQDVVKFEGSVIESIDPYFYLPDPQVPIYAPQDGEYVGWKSKETYMSLRREELEIGSTLLNVQYLRNRPSLSTIYRGEGHGRDGGGVDPSRTGLSTRFIQPVDVIWMYIDLIPKEWEIGDSEDPEKWLFALAGADEIIISMHPMDLDHDMFPVAVSAPDFGGHELTPVSRIEMMSGLQDIINFYFNTHAAEVLKALRNQMLIDPEMVNIRDVENNSRVITTRKKVWGRGIEGMMQQLQVTDVTRNHPADMAFTRQLSREITGAVDAVQGVQRQGGERVTAREFSDTRGAALSKLQRAARIMGMQGHYDLAHMYAAHTQQFMTEDTYIKIAGRWEADLRREYGLDTERVRVTPFDISIAFDIEISDGALTGGEFANDWVQLLTIVLSSEELVQRLDVSRIFMHISRLLGHKNTRDFERLNVETNVVPDEQVAAQVEAGNIVAMEDFG